MLKGDLGRVLFGVVHVLPVVPVAGSDVVAGDGDGGRPGCAAAYGGNG